MQSKAEKNVRASAVAGTVILVIAALVSGIATGKMMWLGSLDDIRAIRAGKVLLGLGLIEGGIGWAYHGIRKVFTNFLQRAVAWAFLFTLVGAILTNLYTERMLSRGVPLNWYQQQWVDWAFDSVIVAVMLSVGGVQLLADDARLERLRLRAAGEEAEERLREAGGLKEFPPEIEAETRETGQLAPGKAERRW